MGLQQHQSASVAVYVVCPSAHPAAPAVAQLLVGACLAPCVPEASADDAAAHQPGGGNDSAHSKRGGAPLTADLVQPAAAASAPELDTALLQPMDTAPSRQPPQPAYGTLGHQPPSRQAAAEGLPCGASAAATAQQSRPPAKQSGNCAAPEPAAEATAKYHGAALQTHTLEGAAPESFAQEALAGSRHPDSEPLDVAIQVRQSVQLCWVCGDGVRAAGGTLHWLFQNHLLLSQVVSRRAMADITGAAVRALAVSLFAKAVRRQQPRGVSSRASSADRVPHSVQEVGRQHLMTDTCSFVSRLTL